MIAYQRAVVRLSRFELGVSLLACAAVIAIWGYLRLRVSLTTIDPGCLLGSGDGTCVATASALRPAVGAIGSRIFELMRILPFGVGLLVGVPIVARELETGTAQTTWYLSAARWRWLARQTLAVGLPAVLAVVFAAAAAADAETLRRASGDGEAVLNIGMYGVPAVARGVAGLAIGLLLGALLGRAVPSLVLGALLCFALALATGAARDAWLAGQPASAIPPGVTTSMTTGWAYQAPDGSLMTSEAAMALVPAAIAAQDQDLAQPINSATWLEDRGYQLVSIGVTQDVAMNWQPIDVTIYILVGTVSAGLAAWVVNRRRPA